MWSPRCRRGRAAETWLTGDHSQVTETAPPIDRLLAPFREFASSSAASGVVLMAAAVVALFWANSPIAYSYVSLWDTRLTIGVGDWVISKNLLHWINDGLMAVFFFVVGLEIKREVLVGELASLRRAALPIAAAVGGALVPALIFLLIVGSGEAARGWAVPIATDIAFALGVLALVGDRIPVGLRVFMAALAIVDDLLAVVIIGLFYTSDVSVVALAAAGGCLAVLVAANVLGVRQPAVYGVIGGALARDPPVRGPRHRRGRAPCDDHPSSNQTRQRRLRGSRPKDRGPSGSAGGQRRADDHRGTSRRPVGA